MKRVEGALELARREIVTGVSLGAGALVTAGGFAFGADLLKVVGPVAMLGSTATRGGVGAYRWWLTRQAARRRRARSLAADGVPLRDVDPRDIGVERAVRQNLLDGGEVPDYVPRCVDSELRSIVVAALAESTSRPIIVLGASKVGKSRTLFEALKASDSAHRMRVYALADPSPESLESVLASRRLARHRTIAVLWLDDVEPLVDGSGWSTSLIREWLAARHGCPRLVVGTFGGRGSQRLALRAGSDGRLPAAQDLLDISDCVPMERTSSDEVAAISAERPDAADELAAYGLAAYLVAGRMIEQKLSTGIHPGEVRRSPDGLAVAHAVMDWAIAGRSDPMPVASLEQVWSDYRPPGQADPNGQRLLEGISWALQPLAGDMALLRQSTDGGLRAVDYAVQHRRAVSTIDSLPHALRSAALRGSPARLLTLAEQALLSGRPDTALAATSQPINEPRGEAGRLLIRALAYFDAGNRKGAIAAYGDLIARFGTDPPPPLRLQVARGLSNRGILHAENGDFAAAVADFDGLVACFRSDVEPLVREQVARALHDRGVTRWEAGDWSDALADYTELIDRYWPDDDPALREQVAKALFNRATGHVKKGDRQLGLGDYTRLIARFTKDSELAITEHVARALTNRAALFAEQGALGAAVDDFTDLIDRFGKSSAPALREQVVRALLGRGVARGRAGDYGMAISDFSGLIARFQDDPAPAVREQVARAFIGCAVVHLKAGNPEAAIESSTQLIERFADDSASTIREQVAAAFLSRAEARREAGEADAAIGDYTSVISRFGSDASLALRGQVARALLRRGVTRALGGDRNAAITDFGELISRYRGESDHVLREQVALAIANRAAAHGENGQLQDAIDGYTALINEFGEDSAPVLREAIIRARVVLAAAQRDPAE